MVAMNEESRINKSGFRRPEQTTQLLTDPRMEINFGNLLGREPRRRMRFVRSLRHAGPDPPFIQILSELTTSAVSLSCTESSRAILIPRKLRRQTYQPAHAMTGLSDVPFANHVYPAQLGFDLDFLSERNDDDGYRKHESSIKDKWLRRWMHPSCGTSTKFLIEVDGIATETIADLHIQPANAVHRTFGIQQLQCLLHLLGRRPSDTPSSGWENR